MISKPLPTHNRGKQEDESMQEPREGGELTFISLNRLALELNKQHNDANGEIANGAGLARR